MNSRLYKILVLGEVNTGKSALIRRYVHDFFNRSYESTIGVDFHVKILPFNDELEIRLQLWDIAGQERFTQLTRPFFKGEV
jgi:small GTP-binding protein